MSRDYKVYLEDMLEAAARIKKYTAGLSKSQFKADDKTLDAVIRNLEVIGEAAKKVPNAVRKRASEVDWKRIRRSPRHSDPRVLRRRSGNRLGHRSEQTCCVGKSDQEPPGRRMKIPRHR